MLVEYDIPQISGIARIVFRIAISGIGNENVRGSRRCVLFLYLRATLV